jgi:hypothetical protein
MVHHHTNELASLVKSVFHSKGGRNVMKCTRHSQRAVVGGKVKAKRLNTLYGNRCVNPTAWLAPWAWTVVTLVAGIAGSKSILDRFQISSTPLPRSVFAPEIGDLESWRTATTRCARRGGGMLDLAFPRFRQWRAGQMRQTSDDA